MSDIICKHYVSEKCTKGDKCNYKHVDGICKHFFIKGTCKFGEKCIKSHEYILNSNSNKNSRKKIKKNTECFEPSYLPSDMRVMIGKSTQKYDYNIQSRDVILVNNLFNDMGDVYSKLLDEIKSSGKEEKGLWKEWHGDSHLIADDHLKWKEDCPIFNSIIERLKTYFGMDVKATRLNWYRDNKDWKPKHHDAAAIDPKKEKTQNFTVGVSFGFTRDAEFEHAKTKTTVRFPLENGSVYAFCKDVNIEWRHGIPPVNANIKIDEGRISVIAWGWVDQDNL